MTARTILITGGSRGIGRATALLAGQAGWNVAVNYRTDNTAARQTADEIEGLGARAITVQGDVTDSGAVDAMFDATLQAFGTLDAVVVNAGIVAPASPLAEMSDERLRRVVETNILGAFYCARAAARHLPRPMDRPSGALVLLSSAAARLGSPNEYVDYAASKGAIDTLTLGLSKELAAQNVRVNAVRPGIIDTDIHASGGEPDRINRIAPLVPLQRAGTAMETAEAVFWLCTDAASYVTGAHLDVAGGR
ncbi:SDR family oxidoreductase [Oceaniglobus trochenteri]|uniref:SDR family oxidoreductase n=1 Tax=Oceaniglobus trochenteri TaxID=2763260 RepID=UPI001D000126